MLSFLSSTGLFQQSYCSLDAQGHDFTNIDLPSWKTAAEMAGSLTAHEVGRSLVDHPVQSPA